MAIKTTPEVKAIDELDGQILEDLKQLLNISSEDEEKQLLVEDFVGALSDLIEIKCLVLLRDILNEKIKQECP